MTRLAWIILTPALVVSACGTAEISTASPVASPAATRVATPAAEVFRSGLYPYSLVLPDGWSLVSSSHDEDYFESADHRSTLTIGTGIPGPGQTVEDRVRENRSQFPGCETDEQENRPIRIGGEHGVLWTIRCEGRYSIAANTIHDGVGYRLRVEVPADREAEAQRIMNRLITSFAFTR